MTWRKWFIRGLALTVVCAVAVGIFYYQRLTNPDAVRSQVLAKMHDAFPGGIVTVESAQLRLLGGISIHELRMARRDDPERTELLYVPLTILYHDKENLLDGGFHILKLELQRPRIRIIRSPDGTWNLTGLTGPPDLEHPVPTIVVKQGTIILEDRRNNNGTPPLEIRDVNLTVVNDPLKTLTIDGSGNSDVLGTVQIHGILQRSSNEMTFDIQAPKIPVGPALIQRLYPFAPEVVHHGRFLEGDGNLNARIHHQPDAMQPWTHDIHFHLTEGKFRHASVPLPLEQVDAAIHIVNGRVTLEHCKARVGDTLLKASFKDLIIGGEMRWEERLKDLDVRLERLSINQQLMEKANLGKLYEDYNPGGIVNVTFTLQREDTGAWKKNCIVEALNGTVYPRVFRYEIDRVTGTVKYESGSNIQDRFTINLDGYADLQPVHLRGTIVGKSPSHAVDIRIWANDLPLDKKLESAFAPKIQEIARSFRPEGKGSFETTIRRDPVTQVSATRHLIHFKECTMRYDKFPYPLENVYLTLDLLPDHWEFRNFRGTHKGGILTGSGGSQPGKDSDKVVVHVEGKNIQLDTELQNAFISAELRNTFGMLQPEGKVDCSCKVSFDVVKNQGEKKSDRSQESPLDVELTVWPKGCSAKPQFFPYPFHRLEGRIHYANRWITLDNIKACNGDSVWSVQKGYTYLKPTGGVYTILYGLEADPLRTDPDLLAALPSHLRKGWEMLEIRDPVGLRTLFIIETRPNHPRPDVYWDGMLALSNAHLRMGIPLEHVTGKIACRGRYNGDQLAGVVGMLEFERAEMLSQPFRRVHSPFFIARDTPDVLCFRDLWVEYFGGAIYGPIRVELGSSMRYEMNLTASQINLEEFGKYNLKEKSQMSGTLLAGLYLTGQGSDIGTLRGNGEIQVPQGKMYNLPLALDLLKVLGLRWPDRTAFEQAQAKFDVEGKQLKFGELNLYGNAISLRGAGTMNLDGSDLNLDFHSDWGRVMQVLPSGVKDIPPVISDQILKIAMRGSVKEVKCTKEILPAVTSPVKKLLEEFRMAERKRHEFAPPGTAKDSLNIPRNPITVSEPQAPRQPNGFQVAPPQDLPGTTNMPKMSPAIKFPYRTVDR